MTRRYLKMPDADPSAMHPSSSVQTDNLSAPPVMKLVNSYHNKFIRRLGATLILLILWQWGSAGWIMAKAQLAQWLIARAWEQMAEQHARDVKPWPWADTYPVARLQVGSRGVDLFVLEGAQGNSLAFGPGHLQGTALPGEGVSVIGGHRDTHFRFLKDMVPGDELQLETPNGRRLLYRIEDMEVVDSRYTPLILEDINNSGLSGLVLVTCYPFDAINPAGPLRLVVKARELGEGSAKHSIEKMVIKPGELNEPVIPFFRHTSLPQPLFTL